MHKTAWLLAAGLWFLAGVSPSSAAEAGGPPPQGATSIAAKVGNVAARFDPHKAWNLNRIEFKGVRLGIDKPGAHYGTVFKFPGVGFIGSGHTENETEAIDSIQFFADGKAVSLAKDADLAATEFRMERRSRVRDFQLKTSIQVKNDRILEQTQFQTSKDVPLDLVYLFMHPWTVTATEYLAGGAGKPEVSGVFADTKGFHVKQDLDWVSEYDAPSGTGLVSRLLKKPESGGATILLWDVPNTYRKFYLRCFAAKTVPAGFAGTYKLVTGFFEATPEKWKDAARKLAAELAEPQD